MKPAFHRRNPHSPIVSGAVDDFMAYAVLPWAFSLHSRAKVPPHFVIGFLEGRLSDKNKIALGSALEYLSISHEFMLLRNDLRFIQQGHISPTTFTKFQLADAIEGEHVWVDIDTVATAGWEDIFSEISRAPGTARLIVAARNRELHVPHEPKKPSDLTFNAGVLGWPAQDRIPWSMALDDADIVETQEQYLFNALYGNFLHTVSEKFNTLTYRLGTVNPSHLPLITHYAGAHKPWHLPRQFSGECIRHQCPWSLWFALELELLEKLGGYQQSSEITRLKREALRSGGFRLSADQRGRALLHALRMLGHMGWLVLWLTRPLKAVIPRGTHPLH